MQSSCSIIRVEVQAIHCQYLLLADQVALLSRCTLELYADTSWNPCSQLTTGLP